MSRYLSVVFDTNVLVSALWTGGTVSKIVKMAFRSDNAIYYSKEILAEYMKVLYRRKFRSKFSLSKVDVLLDDISKHGILLANPTPSTIPLPDESDRIFYDLAESTNSILVTGNSKHYPPEDFIMSPTDFLKSFACEN